MNDSGDYLDEMLFNQSTDRDIERLFDGSLEPSDNLASVAGLLASLRTEASTPLDEGTVAGFVQAASTASAVAARQRVVDGTETSLVHTEGMRRGSLLVSLRRRMAAIAVAVAVFVGGMSGMAVAADHAKPGDTLYGIDRALEAVGIGNGKAAERFIEVQALFDAGEVPLGLQHAAEAVETNASGHSAASAALLKAANRVELGGSAQSTATRENVAGLLSYLSENVHNIDGREVAKRAHDIGRSDEQPGMPHEAATPDTPGPPKHRPVDPPGRPGFTPGPHDPPGNRP